MSNLLPHALGFVLVPAGAFVLTPNQMPAMATLPGDPRLTPFHRANDRRAAQVLGAVAVAAVVLDYVSPNATTQNVAKGAALGSAIAAAFLYARSAMPAPVTEAEPPPPPPPPPPPFSGPFGPRVGLLQSDPPSFQPFLADRYHRGYR